MGIMFKGNKDKNTTVSFANKNKFSPPENDSKDIYKSYLFSVGLMILWAIYTTNNKGGEFPNDVHANTGKLGDLIKNAVDICYKEGEEKERAKQKEKEEEEKNKFN